MNDTFTIEQRKTLLNLAQEAIDHGLKTRQTLHVNITELPQSLIDDRASFVTIMLDGELRGCIGSLQAHRPLAVDIVANAYAAAFQDPRFSPLTADEKEDISIHISILSIPEKIDCKDEQDLIKQLRPGVDGVIIEDGSHRATFLPSVWEHFSEPKDFIDNLKMKAGLSKDHWSNEMQVQRYTADVIE